jgi:uncharacterized protein (UPF0335 family)
MNPPCSLQLVRYLRARRAGCPTEQAAAQEGMTIGEARLHDADEAKGLLNHIDTSEMPHLDFKQPTAPAAGKAPLRESVNAGRDEAGRDPAKEAAGAQPQEEQPVINVAADELRLYLERIERLKEEIKGLGSDVRDVFSEAKSRGFDVPTMRDMLKLRAMEKHQRDEKLALRDTYGVQLGLF